MKILFVNHTASLTGAPISCLQLMIKLGNNFKPVFASRESGHLLNKLNDSNIKTYIVEKKGVLGLKYIAEFIKIIKSERIDILHLNTLTPFCKYAGMAGFIRNIPVLWVIRENPLISRSRKLKFWLKLLSSRIVFVDRDTRERLLPHTNKNIEIVYNGVDTDIFKPLNSDYLYEKFSLDAGQRLIGYIGSITRRKGLEYIVKAMAIIKKKYHNVKLIIIGTYKIGEETYFLYLKELIKELSLQRDVHFTGLLTDIRDALNSLDIVVLASLEERCSRSLLESLASGKAVVATKVGGTPEIVEDGNNGFLVEPENEEQIAESIIKILTDDTLRQKMGMQGRILAEERFAIRSSINRMRELYLELGRKCTH